MATNNNNDIRKIADICEERKPFGRQVRPPIALFSRNMRIPMHPLSVHLCFYCLDATSKREAYEMNSGRWYFTVQMCPRCFEYNRASQDAANHVLERYEKQKSELSHETRVQKRYGTFERITETDIMANDCL